MISPHTFSAPAVGRSVVSWLTSKLSLPRLVEFVVDCPFVLRAVGFQLAREVCVRMSEEAGCGQCVGCLRPGAHDLRSVFTVMDARISCSVRRAVVEVYRRRPSEFLAALTEWLNARVVERARVD